MAAYDTLPHPAPNSDQKQNGEKHRHHDDAA